VTPTGSYWASDRVLTAVELAMLQGFSLEDIVRLSLDQIDDRLLQSFAGNAFSVNVCCATCLCGLAAWQR